MKRLAGIDIGGTKTRCAISSEEDPFELIYRASVETPQQGPDAVLDIVTELLLDGLDDTDELIAVGCVAPGMANTETGMILRAANLHLWEEVHLQVELIDRLDVPVTIENDVNAAAFAESITGVPAGSSPVVFLTISTGIAAGIVINGQIVQGANFAAGEVGAMIPAPKYLGHLWQPGGCTERHSSGSGLSARWADIRGGEADSNRAIEVFHEADGGDETAQELVQQSINYITQVAIGLTCVLDPEFILIGGSIGQARPEYMKNIQQELNNAVLYPPKVIQSTLGDDASLIGALILAQFLVEGFDFSDDSFSGL